MNPPQKPQTPNPVQTVVDAVNSIEFAPTTEIRPKPLLLPGRFPIMPATLTMLLFTTLGFATAVIHFTKTDLNFLMPQAVVQIILFIQIALYHLSYRAGRETLTFLHLLFTILYVAFLDWILLDQITVTPPGITTLYIKTAIFCYSVVPLVNLVHYVFLGRGYRPA